MSASKFDLVTFDCYGTLIDWETGIANAFETALGPGIPRAELLGAYARIEPVVEAVPFLAYRDVLAESARRVASELGRPLAPGAERFLADSLPSWQPFPDTNRALQALSAAGIRLGILSNIDEDLIAATRRHLTADFEFVVTAAQVRSYKPARGHFDAGTMRAAGRSWLHAAQSYFHDVVPCRALGIPVAWVNRKAETPSGEARPDIEVADLASLARAIAG